MAVWAVPGASRTEVSGLHGDAVRVRVAAPPEGGRANRAIITLFAGIFDARVDMAAGTTSRKKRLLVERVSVEEAADALSRATKAGCLLCSRRQEVSVPARKPTAADLKKFRALLEEEQSRLSAVLKAHETEIEEARLAETSADRDADPENADAGAMRYEMQKELAVDLNARDILAKVGYALGRIEAKTYGICEDCGNPIPKARLEAIPYTSLCVKCASARR